MSYKEVNMASPQWDSGWFGQFGDLTLVFRQHGGLWVDLSCELVWH